MLLKKSNNLIKSNILSFTFNFSLSITLCIIYLLSSCHKDSKCYYSCDSGINEFVIKNKARLGGISRSDLASYSTIDSQIAIFRSLTNEKKISIYNEKINLVMNSYSLSDSEKNHLQKMVDFMKPEYYGEEYNNLVDSFSIQWINEAKTKFNWSDKIIFVFSQSWLTESEIMDLARPNTPPGTTPSCNCLSDWACSLATQECNKGVSCNLSNGCGFWGTMKCKGRCNIGGNPA